MKNIYEQIKKVGRRYALPAVVAAALACGANGCANGETSRARLPINPEVRVEMYSSECQAYQDSLNSIRERFTSSIQDKYLSVKEQKKLHRSLKNAEYVSKKLQEKMPEGEKKLYDLLDKNLHRLDFGKPSLEKALEEEKLNVKIQGDYEDEIVVGGALLAFLTILGGASIMSKRKQ